MADVAEKTLKTNAELDKEAIKRFNQHLKESLERETKLHQQWAWRGNKLPPFNIQPMPHERQRLAGPGMTPAERALRKQWVKDQILSANEPRHIPELYPKNPIRRFYGKPWDLFFRALKPVLVSSWLVVFLADWAELQTHVVSL